MTDVDRGQWKGCGVVVASGTGVRYLGKILCDHHWARVCTLSSVKGNGAYLAEMLGLPVVPTGELERTKDA